MTDVRPDIDLTALQRSEQRLEQPRRRWRRFALPALLVVGFAAVFLWSLGDVWTARIAVTVIRPKRSDSGAAAGTAIAFQASGWVEPDPFLMHVTPLTRGTVSEILVQESDTVKKGDPVARLVPDDAELELAAANAQLARTRADVARAEIELAAAKQDFAEAIELTRRVETARAEVAGKTAERDQLEEAAKLAATQVRIATEELVVQQHLREQGAAGPRQVELAEAGLDAARAEEARARAATAHASAQLEVAKSQQKAATRDLELRIEDRRRVDAAARSLEAAHAAERAAVATAALAKLRRERMTVRSPWNGIVLERLTIPGATVGGQGLTHTSICSLYDPSRLRVRVDVPQEDIHKAAVGQRASIVSESRRGQPYRGTVSRIVQQADIQKVTLQLHVSVEQPDELLRPEMLCQIRFEAKHQESGEPQRALVVLVPRRLLQGNSVWVLDADGTRARERTLTVGANRGDHVEVLTGLNLSDKLVDQGRQDLSEGARVRVLEVR